MSDGPRPLQPIVGRIRGSLVSSVPGIALREGRTIARTSRFAWVESLLYRASGSMQHTEPRGPQLGFFCARTA